MIEAKGLTKDYGEKRAVDGLTFTVQPGIVTGFLGPERLRQVDDDAADPEPRPADRRDGDGERQALPRLPRPAPRGRARCSRRAPSTRAAPPTTTCSPSRRRTASRRAASIELIDRVGLHEVARKRVGTFSLGMGQRLGIAAALLADPEILILDEPANGLDPEGIQWIRDLLKELAAEGRTVFVSSHVMSEMALDRRAPDRDRPRPADRRPERRGVRAPRLARCRARPLAARPPGSRTCSPAPDVTVEQADGRLARGRRAHGRAGRRARRRARDRPPRAHAGARLARGGVHGRHPRRGRVQRPRAAREPDRRSGDRRSRPAVDGSPSRHPGAGDPARSGRSSARSARPSGRCSSPSCSTIGLPCIFAAVTANRWSHMSLRERLDRHPLDIATRGRQPVAARDRRSRRARDQRRVLDRDDPRLARRRAEAPAGAVGEDRRLRASRPSC